MKRPTLNLRKLPITPLEMDDEEFTRAIDELRLPELVKAGGVISPLPRQKQS
jgi:hypothetical protein